MDRTRQDDFLALIEGRSDAEITHALAVAQAAAQHIDQQKESPMGWLSVSKPAKRPAGKVAKCGQCKKSLLACKGHRDPGVKEKEKVKVEDKNGKSRTVTRNTGNTVRDGIVWCSCGCRRIGDRCTNVTCSTRRS